MRLAFVWGLCGLVACASNTQGKADDEEAVPEPTLTPGRGEVVPSVQYADTAEGNYARAEERFAEDEYLAAQRYYGYIRSKFPYSRYAVLADLRIADCQFARKRYIEAVDTYQNFVRLHPTHEKVPYARFKVGRAYYEQIPGDWFLLPPAYEKDQSALRDAERALRAYVDRHEAHEDHKTAAKLLADVRRKLMAHERYVADFYNQQDRHRAYVQRLEVIRKDYADVGLDDALLFEIAKVYARLEDVPKTKAAVSELIAKFPESSLRDDAEKLLAKVTPTETAAPEDKGAVETQPPPSKPEVGPASSPSP